VQECKFNNCTHTHEPDCKVLEALEAGEIAPTRYHSYLSILEGYDNRR
jgi:ribosome biogenesis GTPase